MEKNKSNLIYRIMDFPRVVEIFKKNKIYFAHPSSWDDPYETRLRHPKTHQIFASCWCQSGISDAMWRIYSPHGLGVRISLYKNSLEQSIKSWIKEERNGYRWRGREIRYLPQKELIEEIDLIRNDLKKEYTVPRAVDALYLKRQAFSHENEWRGLLFCPAEKRERKGIFIPIDPHKMIRNILIDPRSPDALADAFKHYFKDVLGYSGTVTKSVLYKIPRPIIIDDDIL